MQDHVSFRSRSFNTTEVRPHFINPCCFGEDVAAWLSDRVSGDSVSCGPAFQEDWGWTLPVRMGGARFFVNIGLTGEPGEVPTWRVWVESRGMLARLFRTRHGVEKDLLCRRLDRILSSAAEISHVEWSDDDRRVVTTALP